MVFLKSVANFYKYMRVKHMTNLAGSVAVYLGTRLLTMLLAKKFVNQTAQYIAQFMYGVSCILLCVEYKRNGLKTCLFGCSKQRHFLQPAPSHYSIISTHQ